MMKVRQTIRLALLALAYTMADLLRAPLRVRLRDLPRSLRRAWYRNLLRAYGWEAIAGGATKVGASSGLFFRKVAGGLPYIYDALTRTGNIFFVDSAASRAADSVGAGTHPDTPFLTIDYAIGQCTANQGDVIIVLPGHAETINVAGGITCDIAGVSIIGLGNGEDRPTITVGSTLDTATVLISAADVKLANMIFVPGNDGVDILIDINADGAIIEDCELRSDETNAYQADTYIDINGGANGADRCIVRRCKISSITAGAVQAIEIGAVEADLEISDCVIVGDFSVAGVHSASIFTNALVARNYIHNVNAGDFAIEFSAAATGLLVNNRLYSDAAATCLDPGSMMCIGNEMVNAIDQSSVPVPTTAGGVMATGAIGAASFAAGAIDAAAIANGAIDAATFAAGAIDAAAIANDAIDATAIANGAIDAATFAAGAIDAAAIADNAIDTGAIALSATEKTTEGVIVTKATAALPQTAAAAIFTVTGLCLLKRIVGYVTVQIGAVANATKLKSNSTGGGATTDLCTTLDINGHVIDSRYEITGTFANAMVRTLDVALAKTQVTDVVIPPGTIDLDCAGSDGGTGRVRWSVTYVPMESGAQIVAA